MLPAKLIMDEAERELNAPIDLSCLSSLTGFPKEFIKKELALGHDEISLADLRKSVLAFLDNTFKK